jgi:hypothetical protein
MQKGAAGNRFCREVGHKVFICAKKRLLKPEHILDLSIMLWSEFHSWRPADVEWELHYYWRDGWRWLARSMGESRFLVEFQSPRLLRWGPLKRIEGFFTLTPDPRRWRTLRICLRHGSGWEGPRSDVGRGISIKMSILFSIPIEWTSVLFQEDPQVRH